MSLTALQRIARRVRITKEHYDVLRQALTHKSSTSEGEESASNERLEFLGDSILGMIVSEELFDRFPNRQEGDLAKAKAVLVSEPILADAAVELGIPEAIVLGSGEDSSGGRGRPSILSDAFEAVIAAVYQVQGLEGARRFVLKYLGHMMHGIERDEYRRNYKSMLQELTQRLYRTAPGYVVIKESGADHEKTFRVEVRLNGAPLGRGSGRSKKQAEQAAALEALDHPQFREYREGAEQND